MYRDVAEIRQFYQSFLGRFTARRLMRHIRRIWPDEDMNHGVMIGVGYALPYLDRLKHDGSFAVMSATQGVIRWPAQGKNRTVLTEDHVLPFPDASIDHIFMVHAVENADYLRELMHEVWRVLKPNGRVLMIVPSRAGMWAQSDRTPFGYGRPFSMKQMRSLLNEVHLVVEQHRRALYFFPSHNRLLLAFASFFEAFGTWVLPKFGGVILVEASKRLYNVTPLKVSTETMRASPVLNRKWAVKPVPTARQGL